MPEPLFGVEVLGELAPALQNATRQGCELRRRAAFRGASGVSCTVRCGGRSGEQAGRVGGVAAAARGLPSGTGMSAEQLSVGVKLKVLRPAREVFEAVVDPGEMSKYFITTGSARLEQGKHAVWSFADHGGVEVEVDVVEAVVAKRLAFDWTAAGIGSSRVVMSFEDEGGATELSVREAGWPKNDDGIAKLAEQTRGWTHMLCCLKAYVEHGIQLRAGGTVTGV